VVIASQLRAGMAVLLEGVPYKVVAAEYHPGQGRMGGVAHLRLRNLDTGTFWEPSLRSELRLEEVPLEKQPLEFLYEDGGRCCFMNPETFEQTEIARELVGPQAGFLEPGMKLTVEFTGERPVSVVFPEIMEVKVADTSPPSHQQQDSRLKPATLTNGVEVMVPQFVKNGDVIRLDLLSMKYMDRVRVKGA
jgi:elongation factor P